MHHRYNVAAWRDWIVLRCRATPVPAQRYLRVGKAIRVMRNHKLLTKVFSDDDVTIKATLLIVKVRNGSVLRASVLLRPDASSQALEGWCGSGGLRTLAVAKKLGVVFGVPPPRSSLTKFVAGHVLYVLEYERVILVEVRIGRSSHVPQQFHAS